MNDHADTAHDPGAGWRRLDARMLLVHPVTELFRFLPLLVGLFVLGGSGNDHWHYLGVVVPIAIGLLRFTSTSFRITGRQIELRRGLLSRSLLTAPLDRVRTVELTSGPIHRLLGLATVEVGTGSAARDGDGRVVLDSLGAAEARRLRVALLHRTPLATTAPDGPGAGVPEDTVLLRFDPAWVRYAPWTTSGLVIALAAIAASSQFLGEAIAAALDASAFDERVEALPLVVAVPAGVVAFLVVISALAMIGYLLANWGFLLTRNDSARTFRVRRGLLTTRETSIDLDRFRGVEIHEPLGLRLVGGGRLSAVVTGLRRGTGGGSPLVPPAPREVVVGVGEQVLRESDPLHGVLDQHGPGARQRRYVRAVGTTSLVPAVLLLAAAGSWPLWPALLGLLAPMLGVLLARDRYARLGHALTPAYVVIRAGSLRGRRDVLQRSGIIGWNIRQSWFQRRAGLVTLTATTAAGRQAYVLQDVPEDRAIAFADVAVPGLVAQFLEPALPRSAS